MNRGGSALTTSLIAMTVVAACGSTSTTSANQDGAAGGALDGAYRCSVVQIRNGGCACGEPQPPGSLAGVGNGATFSMTVSGNTVAVPDSFSCSGSWSGNSFTCTITGCGYSGCTACGSSCPNVTFVIEPDDPDPGRALAPGEIYVGIPLDNSFNAHCGRS